MPAATGTHREIIMATDWSDAAKAKRSAAAKKAAETRKANQARKADAKRHNTVNSYFTNSRVARWAQSGVAVGAMMRRATHVRWFRRTPIMGLPFEAVI